MTKFLRIDAYPYLKKAREANCQALIRDDLYKSGEALMFRKGMTWTQLIENSLLRFIHENSKDSRANSRVKRLELIPYFKAPRTARLWARVDKDIYLCADRIRKELGFTWVYVLEVCLNTFIIEK